MRVSFRSVAEQVAIVVIVCLVAWLILLACKPVRVTGSSMTPTLVAGDLVLVDRREQVRVRDIALYRVPGHTAVLHRVVGIGPAGEVHTKGDSNPVVDFDPVPSSAVIGPVRAVIPVGKVIMWWRRR